MLLNCCICPCPDEHTLSPYAVVHNLQSNCSFPEHQLVLLLLELTPAVTTEKDWEKFYCIS